MSSPHSRLLSSTNASSTHSNPRRVVGMMMSSAHQWSLGPSHGCLKISHLRLGCHSKVRINRIRTHGMFCMERQFRLCSSSCPFSDIKDQRPHPWLVRMITGRSNKHYIPGFTLESGCRGIVRSGHQAGSNDSNTLWSCEEMPFDSRANLSYFAEHDDNTMFLCFM